jgi:hypothetical protein
VQAGIVTVTGAVRVMPPPEAATVMAVLPAAACAPALKVRVLVVDPAGTVAGEKAAVTPAGSPLAESATAELNPAPGLRVSAADALAPRVIVTEPGDALTWNEGPTTVASLQWLTMMDASTEPRPVARSYPAPAA